MRSQAIALLLALAVVPACAASEEDAADSTDEAISSTSAMLRDVVAAEWRMDGRQGSIAEPAKLRGLLAAAGLQAGAKLASSPSICQSSFALDFVDKSGAKKALVSLCDEDRASGKAKAVVFDGKKARKTTVDLSAVRAELDKPLVARDVLFGEFDFMGVTRHGKDATLETAESRQAGVIAAAVAAFDPNQPIVTVPPSSDPFASACIAETYQLNRAVSAVTPIWIQVRCDQEGPKVKALLRPAIPDGSDGEITIDADALEAATKKLEFTRIDTP